MSDEKKQYIPWANAGGPNECKHGYAAGIACPECVPKRVAPSAETRDELKLKTLLVRALVELGYVESSATVAVLGGILDSSNCSMFASSEGREIIEKGMKLLGLKDLSEEEIVRVLSPAATNCCTATEVEAARNTRENS
jgi:hypothetical protein